jgi:hypothetical protein
VLAWVAAEMSNESVCERRDEEMEGQGEKIDKGKGKAKVTEKAGTSVFASWIERWEDEWEREDVQAAQRWEKVARKRGRK